MSFENKAEQVGVLSPYAMNPNDIGNSWTDIGAAAGLGSPQNSMSYLGNGIVVAATDTRHILRSVDYGNTWVDLGIVGTAGNPLYTTEYLGNGIFLIADGAGTVYRSTNFGADYVSSAVAASALRGLSYVGNGIVIAGSAGGALYRSLDYGVTWVSVGIISAGSIRVNKYIDHGIALSGDSLGNVYISLDYGATWAGVAGNPISTVIVRYFEYLDNGIVLMSDSIGHVFRSVDFGTTWYDEGVLAAHNLYTITYLGNGIVIIGDSVGHLFRSTDYGLTWIDLGAVIAAGAIWSSVYLGNGVVLLGNDNGHIARSDVSYKLDECMPSVSVGMSSGIGNTIGTSGLDYQQLVIVGGNNVTLSQSISSESATLTISAGAGSGGGTYVSLFQPAIGQDVTSIGLILDPSSVNFYRISIPASISATQYDIIGSLSLASNSTGGYTLSYGVYTMTGSTANLASSASVGSTFTSGSATSASGQYGGQSARRFRSATIGTWNIVPGEYLFAIGLKTANNVSMTLAGPHRVSILGIPGGGNYSKYFYDGVKTSGGSFTGLPTAVQLSEIIRTGDNLKIWWLALAGTF